MPTRPPSDSFILLLWRFVRIGVRQVWESPGNPARTFLLRRQALAILNLPANATAQQIKQRYRTLAKQYHPDCGGDLYRMQQIVAAYELLMRTQNHH